MPSIRVKSMRTVPREGFTTKPHSTSSFRTRFNWRLWVGLGALTGHLLPGGAVFAGHGADRLLVLQVLQAGPAQSRALQTGRPEPPGAEPLLRNRDRGLQPHQAGRRPRDADPEAGGAARCGDVRLLPVPGRPRGVDRARGAVRHAGEPA